MCYVGQRLHVESLNVLDKQHEKVKVNQILIGRRPVATLEVVHVQLRDREKGLL